MHSKKFAMVKHFYTVGAWDKTRVHNAVVKEWITEAEYEEIVGEAYTEA